MGAPVLAGRVKPSGESAWMGRFLAVYNVAVKSSSETGSSFTYAAARRPRPHAPNRIGMHRS